MDQINVKNILKSTKAKMWTCLERPEETTIDEQTKVENAQITTENKELTLSHNLKTDIDNQSSRKDNPKKMGVDREPYRVLKH